MRLTELLRPYTEHFLPGFLPWLATNEEIYRQFERQTLALIRAGWTRFSSRTIVEEIRHYTRHRERGQCSFKINDHVAPDLARAFSVLHPAYVEFWEYRRPGWQDFVIAVKQGTMHT